MPHRAWVEDEKTGEPIEGAPFVFFSGPLCESEQCFREGPHYPGEFGCVASLRCRMSEGEVETVFISRCRI